MQRVAWTDERLDDLSRRMDVGFDRVDRDIRDLRTEMRTGFSEVRNEVDAMRSLMFRMNAGLLLAVIAGAILHGV